MRLRLLASTLACAVLLPVAAAHAAPPSNDARNAAQPLAALPATVTGTTAGATSEGLAEPPQRCGPAGGSVWYSITPAVSGRIAVTAQAAGDLDLVVDVARRVRSQTVAVSCDVSDATGLGATDFDATKGETYLVRVSQRPNSVAGTFALRVSAPIAPATPPGSRLPSAGATRTLARVANPDDAWAFSMRAGRTYRIHLSGRKGRCDVRGTLVAPGTTTFDGRSLRRLACGGYLLYTPGAGEGGRYSMLVRASSFARGSQTYHLQVAPADSDDTAPALAIANHRRIRGGLQGSRIDVVDLYRFEVTNRSVTFLHLAGGAGGFSLQLLDDGGRVLATGRDAIHRGTRQGRYFVAVRANGNASGRYTLTRASRVITHTTVGLSGGAGGLTATATTSPANAGAYDITFERFDPLAGWLFAKRVRVRGSGGTASARWTPPGVGRYRARASYLGTRDAAASNSGTASIRVG